MVILVAAATLAAVGSAHAEPSVSRPGGAAAVGSTVGPGGALQQKTGVHGCISEDGTDGACSDGRALDGAYSAAVSPDGTSVYAASYSSDAVTVFDRDPDTGTLTQKPGTDGCISDTGTNGTCTDGTALDSAESVTVSPDGANLYATAVISDAVTVFDRDPDTGALTQKPGTDGCISDTGTNGTCAHGTALGNPYSVTVSPDGANLYTASGGPSDAVAVFDRDPTTGTLTQKPGTGGCISETGTAGACTDGTALIGAQSVTVSPDGANLYAAAITSDAVTVFDRDPATGTLTQKPGTDGCISDTGTNGTCAHGTALDYARSVTVSPDGTSVYAASYASDAVAVFDRDPATGALAQKPGTDGCISDTGTNGTCTDGRALDGTRSVTVSPDGASVYAASDGSDAVAVFDRDPATGALTQKPGIDGCISDTGTNGRCADGTAVDATSSVAVSPDGANLYATAFTSDAVAVFDRCGVDAGPFCVTGTVTDADAGGLPAPAAGAPAAGTSVVFADAATGTPVRGAETISDGTYRVRLPAGDYHVAFVDRFADRAPEWFDDIPLNRPDLAQITTVDGPAMTVDAELLPSGRTGAVTGAITDAITGDPLTGAWAAVIDPDTGILVAGELTGANGAYTVGDTTPGGPPGLAPGRFEMVMVDPTGAHRPAYLTDIDVAPGEATPVDVALDRQTVPDPTSSLSGVVTDHATGTPMARMWVPIIDHTGRLVAGAVSRTGGGYVAAVSPGDYRVAFQDPTGTHAGEWFDDEPLIAPEPVVLTVPPGGLADIDAALDNSTGTVAGTVTAAGSGTPLQGVWVLAIDARTGRPSGGVTTGPDGRYALMGHRPGTPLVLAFFDPTGTHRFEYHHDAADFSAATPITVITPGMNVDEDLTPTG